jgi:low affinity Fe/Cu permease
VPFGHGWLKESRPGHATSLEKSCSAVQACKEGKREQEMQTTKRDEPQLDETISGFNRLFGDIANRTSRAAGRALTFVIAAVVVLAWAVTGPYFNYSDTWQLVINTGTTIVTFLMVFLIQHSQNRDSAAIQVKLNELIRVSTVHNSFVGIENLTDEEIEELRTKCELRAKKSVEKTSKKARQAADQATE